MKKTLIVSVFILLGIAFNTNAEVKINEVLFNPVGTDTSNEWVELYNSSDENQNISGYELNATSGDYFKFPENTLIMPNKFIIIWWRKDGVNTDKEFYTGTNGFDSNMGNSYGWIALFKNSEHSDETIADYIEYGKGMQTWETTAMKANIWTENDFINISKTEGYSIGKKQDGLDNNISGDLQEFNFPTMNAPNSPTQNTPTPTPIPSSTPEPTPTQPSPTPPTTQTPNPTPTPTFAPKPTSTPTPSSTPTKTPPTPTLKPTQPSQTPKPSPTQTKTIQTPEPSPSEPLLDETPINETKPNNTEDSATIKDNLKEQNLTNKYGWIRVLVFNPSKVMLSAIYHLISYFIKSIF